MNISKDEFAEAYLDAMIHGIGFLKITGYPNFEIKHLKLSELIESIEDLKKLKESLITEERI